MIYWLCALLIVTIERYLFVYTKMEGAEHNNIAGCSYARVVGIHKKQPIFTEHLEYNIVYENAFQISADVYLICQTVSEQPIKHNGRSKK